MSVRSQRQKMLQVPVGVGTGLGGCWCRSLDQPELGREEAGAAAHPEQGQILWPCNEERFEQRQQALGACAQRACVSPVGT